MDGLQQPVSNKYSLDTMLAQLQELSAAMDKLMVLKGLSSSTDPEKRDEQRVSSSSRRWQPTSPAPAARVYNTERQGRIRSRIQDESNGFQRDNNYRPFRGRTRGCWTRSVPAGQDGQDFNNERGCGRYSNNANQSQ